MEQLIIPSIQTYDCVVPHLIDKAKDIADHSVDYTFDTINEIDFNMSNDFNINFNDGTQRSFGLTEFATRQLCQRVGMPIQFFNSLSSDKNSRLKELAVHNINELSKAFSGSMMIRTTADKARGILSNKYTSFDVDKVLDVFDDVMHNSTVFNREDLRFRGSYITLDRFHIRFTSSQPLVGLPDKDLYLGLQLDSSDVGKAKLSVRFYIYKQICTNGMCIAKFNNDLFVQRHINISKDDFKAGLERSLVAYPVIEEQAREMLLKASYTDLRNSKLFDLENNEPVQKALRNYFRLTDDELLDVVDISKTFYPRTLWGFANAVTHKAKEFGFERRNIVETLAGNFLTEYRRLGVA